MIFIIWLVAISPPPNRSHHSYVLETRSYLPGNSWFSCCRNFSLSLSVMNLEQTQISKAITMFAHFRILSIVTNLALLAAPPLPVRGSGLDMW